MGMTIMLFVILLAAYGAIAVGKQKGGSSSQSRKTQNPWLKKNSIDLQELKNGVKKASTAILGEESVPTGGKKRVFSKRENQDALGIRHEKNDPCKMGWEYDVGEKKRKRKKGEDPWDW